MVTRCHAIFIIVFLELLILIPGNCDVIISAKASDHNVNVSFPVDLRLFDDLHACLCDVYERCSAKYDDQDVCDYVTKYKYEIQNRAYYECGKVTNEREIRCTLTDSDPGGVAIQELNCQWSTVTLHWSSGNEGIIFDDSALCQKYCVAGCYCPAKTTTLTPPKTPKSFSSRDPSSFSTSASPTTTSEKYEDDIPQGVLIGVLVGLIVPAVIIIIVVFGIFLWKRRRNEDTPEPEEGETSGFTKTQGLGNVRSSPQNGPEWMSIDPPHNILFCSPSNYSHYVNDINGGVPSNTTDHDTGDVKENSVHDAKTVQLSATSENDKDLLDMLKKYAVMNSKGPHDQALEKKPDKAHDKGDNHSDANTKTEEGATASHVTSSKSSNQSSSKPVVSRAYLMNRGVDVDDEDFDIVKAANLFNSLN